MIDDGVVAPERVMLIFTMPPPALVAHRRQLCSAWTDARHGDPDVLLRCSPDAGRRWEPLRRVNDDRLGNGVHQYLPRLSVSPGGRLDIVFFDRRRDRTNAANDVVYSHSNDGGRRFAPARRLTAASSSSAIGQRYAGVAAEGQVEIGGRLGLLSRRSSALAAWPDSRNSEEGTGQDLFTARVEGLWTGRRPGWPRPAGALLVVAGLALLGRARHAGRASRATPST